MGSVRVSEMNGGWEGMEEGGQQGPSLPAEKGKGLDFARGQWGAIEGCGQRKDMVG